MESDTITNGMFGANIGITTTTAKYPQYGSYNSRLSTYSNMSSAVSQSKESLASAGFFFAGQGDLVRCFYCGGGLRNWETIDDPRTEHKRWFPKCDFLNKFSNQEPSVERAAESSSHERSLQLPIYIARNSEGHDGQTSIPTIENLEYIIAAKAVLHLGYSRDDVGKAFQICSKENRKPVNARQLLCKILELNHILEPITRQNSDQNANEMDTETDSFHEIERENVSLKQKLNCKLCQEAPAEMAFLPCGHLAACMDCGPAIKYCLLCQVRVKATVKVFMS